MNESFSSTSVFRPSSDLGGMIHAAQGEDDCHRQEVVPELQGQYYADPEAGPCPCYNMGDEFVFERYDDRDRFIEVYVSNDGCEDAVRQGVTSAGVMVIRID